MAEFPNIPIDVSAKEIEEKVKEKIEDFVKKGSKNPVSSNAVAIALENVEVGTDNIKDGSVTDNKLESTYLKLSTLTIRDYTDLDNLIDNEESERTKYTVDISGLSSFAGIVGDGFFSAITSGNSLELTNHKTGKSWYYEKGSNKLIETLSNKMNSASSFYVVDTLGDSANPELLAYQTHDPTTQSYLRVPISKILARADFINLGEFSDIKRLDSALSGRDTSKVYRFSFRYDISIGSFIIPGTTEFIGYLYNKNDYGTVLAFGKILFDGVEREIGLSPAIANQYEDYWENYISDQNFDPKSKNPQSGKAVKAGISQYITDILISDGRLEDLVNAVMVPGSNGYAKERVRIVKAYVIDNDLTSNLEYSSGSLPQGHYYCVGSINVTNDNWFVTCWNNATGECYLVKRESRSITTGNGVVNSYRFDVTKQFDPSDVNSRLKTAESDISNIKGKIIAEYITIVGESNLKSKVYDNKKIYLALINLPAVKNLRCIATYEQGTKTVDGETVYTKRRLNCIEFSTGRHVTIDFADDVVVTIFDSEQRITNIEGSLNGLEDFLASI